MANEDKFLKEIDDVELDEVAGGTTKEQKKDIAFLNAIAEKCDKFDIDLSKNAASYEILCAWRELGINFATIYDNSENIYTIDHGNKKFTNYSRQDAMIIAMRNARVVVDLDKYL